MLQKPTESSTGPNPEEILAGMLAEYELALAALSANDVFRVDLALTACDRFRGEMTTTLGDPGPAESGWHGGDGSVLDGLVKLQGVNGRLTAAVEQQLGKLFVEIQQLQEEAAEQHPYGTGETRQKHRIDLVR